MPAAMRTRSHASSGRGSSSGSNLGPAGQARSYESAIHGIYESALKALASFLDETRSPKALLARSSNDSITSLVSFFAHFAHPSLSFFPTPRRGHTVLGSDRPRHYFVCGQWCYILEALPEAYSRQ